MATASSNSSVSAPQSGAKPARTARQIKNIIPLTSQQVAVYASPKISKALSEITEDMTLYHGVRLSQVLEAVYNQGQKDGARNAILEIQDGFSKAIDKIPHRNPGKPKSKSKKK